MSHLDKSLQALADIIPKPVMVHISHPVPVRDIDFSVCTCELTHDTYEIHGARCIDSGYEIDLTGATYQGQPVEIADSDIDAAYAELLNQRGIA